MDKFHTVYDISTGEMQEVPFTENENSEYDLLRFEEAVVAVRVQRNHLLRESDIFVLPDRWDTYSVEKKNSWSDYRQALRDLPATVTNPFEINWPIKPE